MNLNMTKLLALLLLAAVTIRTAMAEGTDSLNGTNVRSIIVKLGEPDQVRETQSRQKVYAWAVTSTESRYTGTPERPLSSKPVTTVCVLQALVDNSGTVKDNDIEGNLLPCALLKKRLGLI